MTTAIERTEQNPVAVIEAAIEKGLDPEKLLDFFERIERNRAAEAFGRAITQFQSRCPRITKRNTADIRDKQDYKRVLYSYAFASYDDIDKIIRPLLVECGLAISFSTDAAPGGIKITCRIRHGTHFEDHTLTVPIPAMNVNDTQKYGAALSYAKRYVLCAALNIVVTGEDDDAGQMDMLTESQAKEVAKLLEESGGNKEQFLKFLRAESIEKIARSRYKEVVDLLNQKKARAKK